MAVNHSSMRVPFSKPRPAPPIRQRGSGSGMISPGGSTGGSGGQIIGSQQHGVTPHVSHVPQPPTLMQTRGPPRPISGPTGPPGPTSIIRLARSMRI